MLGNGGSGGEPDTVMALGIIDKAADGHDSPRPPCQPAMQANIHHFCRSIQAFGIKTIECIFQISEKLIASVKPLGGGKPHIIGIKRVRHHQLLAMGGCDPIGQVIGVTVRLIEAWAGFRHEINGIH